MKINNTIACVVLTKNEEITLPRCLQSVAWCNERVVVDSGSSDRTRELAVQNGARVLIHIQKGAFNIAEQRNWALDQAEIASTWVLFLDADEEITQELKSEIQDATENAKGFNCFELTPRYLFWGRWLKRTQGYPNWHPRLLLRQDVRFAGGVWEHFAGHVIAGRLYSPYNHYANSKGLSDWLERHDRYSSWDAAKILDFLESGNTRALGTERKITLRKLAARWYPLRPIIRFLNLYIIRGGVFEGLPGLAFSFLYFFYESLIVLKVIEGRRLRQGKAI
jgi:glycosyltransferase involved in cell wall biosynthesis